jgi:hypothetical protein
VNWINWINTLQWYQWLVLGLVPPLIFLLYFLKLRRMPVEVPSTYLWKKTVEDMHVNSIWQRLRKNLLLLLQLIALMLLILSVLRPGCDGQKLSGDRFIFLVDKSASMGATDTENGSTRLDEAKDQIYTLIDRMKSSDAAMVISFSDTEGVDQSYTTNKSLLKRKVKSIKQTQRGSDMNRALVAASGLANPGRTSDRSSQSDVQVAEAMPATMYIFSDGAIKKIPRFLPGALSPEYRPVGALEPADNVGITAFSINDQLDAGGQVQIFSRLQNSGLEEKTVGISLYVDGELEDARRIVVPGREASDEFLQLGDNNRIANIEQSAPGGVPLNFDLTAIAAGLEDATPIRLQIDEEDVYMLDNEAFCVLNPARLANVLIVTDYNEALELACDTDRMKKIGEYEFVDRDFLEEKEYKDNAALGVYDLIIFDQCTPESMPACNTIFIGALPKSDDWSIVEETDPTTIIYSNINHPTMFDVQMSNVIVSKGTVLKGPVGSTSLVDSVDGSVMMIGPRLGFEDLVIGFPMILYDDDTTINTDWQKHPSFPFFMQNIVVALGSGSRFNATQANKPGQSIKIKPLFPYAEIDVVNPKNNKLSLKANADTTFLFSQTDQSGIYEVREKGSDEVDQMFAVNLLDRLESDLGVRDELALGYEKVEGKVSSEPARKDYWTLLILGALVVISIEWYIYNRRVFI